MKRTIISFESQVVNGGAYTRSGIYYSWDVRLSSFFVGLVFLALYYRRYHVMKDMTPRDRCFDPRSYVPVVLCCKEPGEAQWSIILLGLFPNIRFVLLRVISLLST